MQPQEISQLLTEDITLNQGLILEIGLRAIARRVLDQLQNKPTFGPGVDPAQFKTGETIQAQGDPLVKFEHEYDKAVELEKAGQYAEASKIYKRLADIHPISGLKSKSYYRHHGEKRHRIFILADLDNLKYLNTKLGHKGADSVLGSFGKLLTDNFGGQHHTKVFHPHGDEFVVIIDLEGKTEEEIKVLAQEAYQKCRIVSEKFGSLVFSNNLGKAKASATFGIGFNENTTDELIDKKKIERKRIIPFSETAHIFINPDIADTIKI